MGGGNGGDHRHMRARHAGQRRDLAGVAHADLDHRKLGGRGASEDPAAVSSHAPTEAVSLKCIGRSEDAGGVTTGSIRLLQVKKAGAVVCPPGAENQDLTTEGDIVAQLPIGDRWHRELLALIEHEPGTIEQVSCTILTIRDRGSDQQLIR